MTSEKITALGNALWSGSSLALAVFCLWVLSGRVRNLKPPATAILMATVITTTGAATHRIWWNTGIVLRDQGHYLPFIEDHKHWTLVPVLMIVVGCLIAMLALLDAHMRVLYTTSLVGWLIIWSAAWVYYA